MANVTTQAATTESTTLYHNVPDPEEISQMMLFFSVALAVALVAWVTSKAVTYCHEKSVVKREKKEAAKLIDENRSEYEPDDCATTAFTNGGMDLSDESARAPKPSALGIFDIAVKAMVKTEDERQAREKQKEVVAKLLDSGTKKQTTFQTPVEMLATDDTPDETSSTPVIQINNKTIYRTSKVSPEESLGPSEKTPVVEIDTSKSSTNEERKPPPLTRRPSLQLQALASENFLPWTT